MLTSTLFLVAGGSGMRWWSVGLGLGFGAGSAFEKCSKGFNQIQEEALRA